MKLKDLNQPAVWLFKLVAIAGTIILLLTSCSTTTGLSEGEQMREELHKTNTDNRNIVGYEYGIIFKKRMYYTVTDSKGNPALRIHKRKSDTLREIGGVFLLKDEYKLQH